MGKLWGTWMNMNEHDRIPSLFMEVKTWEIKNMHFFVFAGKTWGKIHGFSVGFHSQMIQQIIHDLGWRLSDWMASGSWFDSVAINYWLVVTGTWLFFSIQLGIIWNNHPNWRTHIFQRSRTTTNQIRCGMFNNLGKCNNDLKQRSHHRWWWM